MRLTTKWQWMVLFTLGLGLGAWAQQSGRGRGAARGGRGQATTAAAPAATAPPIITTAPAPAARGRGGRGAPAGPNDFYDYSATAPEEAPIPDTPPVESQQKVTLDGQVVNYTARVGYMPVNNATTGEPEAHLFYTYYAKQGGSGDRPLLFLFGGAPGAAASWIELGGFGPKRIQLQADGSAGLPPYHVVDNPETLLGEADLVFVNPIGTGFSRPDHPSLNAKFATPGEDAASLGEFVRSFLGTYDRWNSPRFLAGEDYGTGRVANLASYLASHELPVNGVAILSTSSATDATAGDEQYMTLLPSEIMTSWYHKKLSADLQALSAAQIADRARAFASREYLHALYQGDRIAPAELAKVLGDLSHLTGLSKFYIANNDLRLTTERYTAELLREQHESISDSDSRFTGYLRPGGGGRGGRGAATPAPDARRSELANGMLTAYEQYLRHDLNFTNNGVYYLSQGGTSPWAGAVSDDTSLEAAFDRNPRMRVFVALNYYDLNSPFYAAEFTLAHLQVPAAVLAHGITTGYFSAGEMPYTDAPSLRQLRSDLSKFIQTATAPAAQ